MRTKKCLKCGNIFETDLHYQTQCDDCLAAARATTIRPRVCRQCGATFDGGPRAWYCPDCRAIRRREADARHRQHGPARPLGSIDCCEVCGKAYTVNSARQRYCPSCAPAAVREKDREASKAWNRANDYYAKRCNSPRSGVKVCIVCGGEFESKLPTVTCSEACTRLRRKEIQRKASAKYAKAKRKARENETVPKQDTVS